MTTKPENRLAAECKCPCCGAPGKLKVSQKGKLYFYCSHPADGGCLMAFQARHEKSEAWLATFATKWRDGDQAARFGHKVKADRKPKPSPEPDAADEPEPEADDVPAVDQAAVEDGDKKTSIWEREWL